MTQLTEKEHKCQMADMKAFDEQMPCIGIFWYDLESHSLFGVHKKEITPKMVEEAAEKGLPFINYPHLHRQVWAKEYFKAQAKHEETKVPDFIGYLYTYFVRHPDLLAQENKTVLRNEGVERAVCDYIAGMTDHYAIEKYKELFIPRAWSKS